MLCVICKHGQHGVRWSEEAMSTRVWVLANERISLGISVKKRKKRVLACLREGYPLDIPEGFSNTLSQPS